MSITISENNTSENDVIYEIYFNYQCNYKCTYCYSHSGAEKMTFEDVNILLTKFNNIENKKNITIQFLGGEPLLYEHFEYFLTNISREFNLTLTTNFKYLNNFVDLVNKFDNLEIEFSLHYEYFSIDYFANLFNLLNKIKVKKLLIFNINPSIEFDKYNKQLVDVSNNLQTFDIKNVEIVTNAIDNHDISAYFDLYKVKENSEKNYTLYDSETKKTELLNYNDTYSFLKKKYNFNYKMSICYYSFFRIDYNLNVEELCNDPRTIRNLRNDDIIVEPLKRICLLNNCENSCLFNCKKILKKINTFDDTKEIDE